VATLPPLTGDRQADWRAFAAVYALVERRLPASETLRQELAAATMTGMVGSLADNHARWIYPILPPGAYQGDDYGLGFQTSPALSVAATAPAKALGPMFITSTDGGPAVQVGLRRGDVIVAVNGVPPFVDGVVSAGVIDLLGQVYPQRQALQITFHRPATGRTWTVRMQPRLYASDAAATNVVSATVGGDVVYVRMSSFLPLSAYTVLGEIVDLWGKTKPRGVILDLRGNGSGSPDEVTTMPRGVILDLRGNGGGSPDEVATLLGAFTHGKVWSYDCAVGHGCMANHTDDTVPLLHLRLVVLTDRNCVSLCDAFAAAVKDLHLGTLVGTRTAGIVSGPAAGYMLNDGSVLALPARHELGPIREVINGIGVAPDYFIPVTAAALSRGQDPDIAKGLRVLGR
jgi:carboxyl-terminal processing protease